ncbi:MAG: PTS lactose/cellobiose transporter subunit IIA [Firmicutes bacterium HGW-Firmicutes-7]|nr:MAG: PTS lactose/cellobiose transporter subunit IIA [Firmicutes bacterium HGW-Firmicutes-7]
MEETNPMEIVIMQLIVNAGAAKNHAYAALAKANEGNYIGAEEEMQNAENAIAVAHESQTSLLTKEASGEKVEISMLFVHAQDHLMTALTEKNLIEQIIELRKVVNKLISAK